ncbi:GNAT family N-acetyltransferase [Suttonella ornithocola]|uniref:Ribosomal-protein-serine acetyltransferase n=1 Tax=Suttonella ornithocola TaxID=279832 RepID=A0A380MYH7_9GAMM|nr:GNAT family N-acetyltransferase [Suttonella ornithocola]SUO97630.1 Ribosomal-protein-serine acetyltransferase [Suttonella ornithocola]
MTILRSFELADADAVFALIDSNRAHLGRFLPWVEKTNGVEETRAFLQQVLVAEEKGTEKHFAVVDEQGVIGTVCARGLQTPTANLGYWLAKDYCGRGMMCDAVVRLEKWLQEHTDIQTLLILTHPENIASQKVAERCGFVYQGMKNH